MLSVVERDKNLNSKLNQNRRESVFSGNRHQNYSTTLKHDWNFP